jgi:5'-methylthioadenosine phosphorylase
MAENADAGHTPRDIRIGLIGGSGLGQLLAAQAEGHRHEVDTPFGRPSDAVVETNWGGLPVFFLSRHGPGHVLNPSQVPYRANLFALKKLGVTHVIASGAVGSLRDEFRPRDLVIPDQVIDKTHKRPNTFFEKAAVHVELAEPFCPVLRRILLEEGSAFAAGASGDSGGAPRVHDRGCYVCMEGPAFSTRAESLMHRLWGGDLIGMTAMPEARLAREAEIGYALVALVTDYDCWRRPGDAAGGAHAETHSAPEHDPAVLLKEIIANLQAASDNGIRLIRRAVERVAASADDRQALLKSPALSSLRLAIWSDKARIDRGHVEQLGPVWMKYFEQTPT